MKPTDCLNAAPPERGEFHGVFALSSAWRCKREGSGLGRASASPKFLSTPTEEVLGPEDDEVSIPIDSLWAWVVDVVREENSNSSFDLSAKRRAAALPF